MLSMLSMCVCVGIVFNPWIYSMLYSSVFIIIIIGLKNDDDPMCSFFYSSFIEKPNIKQFFWVWKSQCVQEKKTPTWIILQMRFIHRHTHTHTNKHSWDIFLHKFQSENFFFVKFQITLKLKAKNKTKFKSWNLRLLKKIRNK